jgi:hypothetical protein
VEFLRKSIVRGALNLIVDDVEGDWLEKWGEDEVLNSEEFQENLDHLVAIARYEGIQKES